MSSFLRFSSSLLSFNRFTQIKHARCFSGAIRSIQWVKGNDIAKLEGKCIAPGYAKGKLTEARSHSQYWSNAVYYWENRKDFLQKYGKYGENYVAVANHNVIASNKNRESAMMVASDATDDTFFLTRVGLEELTFIDDNLCNIGFSPDDNVIHFGEVAEPDELEWLPQKKGSFEPRFRIIGSEDGKFRNFVTLPIILPKDPNNEYPVTFLVDSGAKCAVMSHLVFARLTGAYGAIKVGTVSALDKEKMKYFLLHDLGPTAPSCNVNVLPEDIIYELRLYDKLADFLAENYRVYGGDRSKWPMFQRTKMTESGFWKVMDPVVERLRVLHSQRKLTVQ